MSNGRKRRLDLSEQIPPNAKSVLIEFKIDPPTVAILLYRIEEDPFPTILRDSGTEMVQLLIPQTLLIEATSEVTYTITVLGYSV